MFNNINQLTKRADDVKKYEEAAKLMDMDSFACLFLINEITNEVDINLYSMFYIYDENLGKIKSGPVWDFDRAWQDDRDKGCFVNVNSYMDGWAERLYENDEFKKLVADEYIAHREFFTSIPEKIDSYAKLIENSIAMDTVINDFAEENMVDFGDFDANIKYLKDKYNERFARVVGNLKANGLVDDNVEKAYRIHVDMMEQSRAMYIPEDIGYIAGEEIENLCYLTGMPEAELYLLNGTEVWAEMPVSCDMTLYAYDPSVIKRNVVYGE